MSKTFYAVGIAGLIASFVGYFLNSDQFLHSYLTSFTFYTSIALACLIFVMIHHITKSSWGTVIRRIPEAFISNIWIWAIFLIPVLLGVTSLRSEEHTSELQSRGHLVCRLLLEKKKNTNMKN